MNIIEYKGLKGTIEYSAEDGCLIGKILDLDDGIIIYEGDSVAEIIQMFHEAVDDYLEEKAQKRAENFNFTLLSLLHEFSFALMFLKSVDSQAFLKKYMAFSKSLERGLYIYFTAFYCYEFF